MSSRHQSRKWALQFLFQHEMNPAEDIAAALADFWANRALHAAADALEDDPDTWQDDKVTSKACKFMEDLVRGVLANQAEIDGRLGKYAENWDLRRMGHVERNVMRMAVYEILHCPDIPPVVSINEGVELAKEFSGTESGHFVNGILDRARKDVRRPARSPAPGAAAPTSYRAAKPPKA